MLYVRTGFISGHTKKPTEPRQVPRIQASLAVEFQSGADGGRGDCPRAAQGMISTREAGRSRHWASTAGGRSVRGCQRSNGSARKAVDRPPGTGGGRPGRGEAVRNRPLFAGPRGMRDSPRHSRKGWVSSVLTCVVTGIPVPLTITTLQRNSLIQWLRGFCRPKLASTQPRCACARRPPRGCSPGTSASHSHPGSPPAWR